MDSNPLRLISPCDGTLSIAGTVRANEMLQAKGHSYSLEALLAAEPNWVQTLRDGSYATLYLAPYNYHRVHMPLSGRLQAAWHVPGRLFSVNDATVARVPGLFARNERVVLAFDGEHGPFVVVMVGALFVGSMSTVWHGEISPWRGQGPPHGSAPYSPTRTEHRYRSVAAARCRAWLVQYGFNRGADSASRPGAVGPAPAAGKQRGGRTGIGHTANGAGSPVSRTS